MYSTIFQFAQITSRSIFTALIIQIILFNCNFQANCSSQADGQLNVLRVKENKDNLDFGNSLKSIDDYDVSKVQIRKLFNQYTQEGEYTNYDNSNIEELQINQSFKFNFRVQNATFQISNYSQNKYTYIEFYFDNSQDFQSYNNLNTPRLLANIDQAPYFYLNNKNQTEIKAQYFDSNGYYQNKNRFYLLIISDTPLTNTLYLTLLLDQSFLLNQQLNYQFTIKIIGQSNSKPCPFGCLSLGSCVQGKCMCQQNQIDEDCSQSAQKVEINQTQYNQVILKPNIISYVYMKTDNLMTLQQLKVSLKLNNQIGTTCILYQNPYQSINNLQSTEIPTILNFNKNLCLGPTSIQQNQQFILTEGPINLTVGQVIPIGLILKNQYEDQQIFYQFQLFEDQSDSYVDSDDVITIISIVCSFLVTFTMVFICFQYCRSRHSNDNLSSSFENPIILESNSEQQENQKKADKKKINKKILEKYLPSQQWEQAKLMLKEQKRELTEPFICLVCHLNIENGEKVRVSICYHVLHIECFDEWFINKEFCPMCRREHKLDDLKNNKRGISNNKFEEKMIDMAKVFMQNSQQQADSCEIQQEQKKKNSLFSDNTNFSNIIVYKPNRNKNLTINPKRKQSNDNLTHNSITSPYLLSQSLVSQQYNSNQKSIELTPTVLKKKETNTQPNQITDNNYNNKHKKTVNTHFDIQEVEAEDDENFNSNPNNDKRSSFMGGEQLLLNLISFDYQNENGISRAQDNQVNRNKQNSFQSSLSDFSNFSPVNMKKFKESQNQIFEQEGSLDLCDQSNNSQVVFQNNLSNKLLKRLSNSPQKYQDNQISFLENNFGQSIILEKLNDKSIQKNKIVFQNLLPQDQL
ncbi:RING finger protein (macronuclear) [Tetrahymena thermophila SB210]|uniref:RING finger protein n=1 Tax=Tetrahymena thermophila (strain SB210) TaxID=312017 RepID=I7MFW2_TETTS|nr:RING finger protein [Tetrahymena thermophila SB210]EAR84434.1 RING finger protein [Tetrahymena thermophila SB210]|eukprot:XP_001032097.1 RING finger protein [Tetrahymena thermophila SB210]